MGKSFQDRIKELQDYRPDIMYKDGAFIMKIRFNKNWRIIEPKDDTVAYSKDEQVENLHWFVSTIEDSDKLFDLVDEIISINKEFEKKANLYKEKVKELQELFLSDTPYEKLKLVQFVINDKETKPKGKKAKQKKQSADEPVDMVESVAETSESNKQEDMAKADEASEVSQEYTGVIDNIIEQALGK